MKEESNPAGTSEPPLSRALIRVLLPRAALITGITLYVVLALYFLPPRLIFSTTPLGGGYFDLYSVQVGQTVQQLSEQGQTWGYSPDRFGGFPSGVAANPEIKGWALWTWCLGVLGIPWGLAFNLFLFFAVILLPPVVYLTARQLCFSRTAALTAAGLAGAIWFFDSHFHWSWYMGNVPVAWAGYFLFLPMGLFFGYLRQRTPWRLALTLLTALFVMLLHPSSAILSFGFALIPLYLSRSEILSRRTRLTILAVALCPLVIHWDLLTTWMQFDHQLRFGAPQGATPVFLLTDLFGLAIDREITGGLGNRSGFRLLALATAGLAVFLLRRQQQWDNRLTALTGATLGMLIVAYLSGTLGPLQPFFSYRAIIPATFGAVLLTAHLITEVQEKRLKLRMAKPLATLLLIASVLIVPRLARDILYFVPAMLPVPTALPEEKPYLTDVMGFGGIGFPRQNEAKITPPSPVFQEIAHRLRQETQKGRIITGSPALATYLMRSPDLQVLDGVGMLASLGQAPRPFDPYAKTPIPPNEVHKYVRQYNVSWVITKAADEKETTTAPPPWLEPAFRVPPFTAFRVTRPTGDFKKGSGRIQRESNQIRLLDTKPDQNLVIRYHWTSHLRCQENCTLKKEPIPGAPMGFIRIPAPHPANMVIQAR